MNSSQILHPPPFSLAPTENLLPNPSKFFVLDSSVITIQSKNYNLNDRSDKLEGEKLTTSQCLSCLVSRTKQICSEFFPLPLSISTELALNVHWPYSRVNSFTYLKMHLQPMYIVTAPWNLILKSINLCMFIFKWYFPLG